LRTVFVDPQRCIGCGQCELACSFAHAKTRDPVMALMEQPSPRPRVHVQAGLVPNTAYPNKCHHCNPAPCMGVCPSGAIARDADQGTVRVNEAKCIACAMCAIVCPFDVITYHPQDVQGETRVVAVKCDGCYHRVKKGQLPACVEVCKVGALRFGEINELVAADSRREAERVLVAATGQEPEPEPGADGIAAWRATGAYVAHLRSDVR
jgi:anaerobic carbon-monoxide dehydrogenase iron sulfur subunit